MTKRANWRVSRYRVHPRAEVVQFGQPAPTVSSLATHRSTLEPRAVDGGCLRAAGYALPTSVGSAVARAFYSVRRALSRLTETPHEAAQRRAAEWLPVLLLAEAKGVHVRSLKDADFGGKALALGACQETQHQKV